MFYVFEYLPDGRCLAPITLILTVLCDNEMILSMAKRMTGPRKKK